MHLLNAENTEDGKQNKEIYKLIEHVEAVNSALNVLCDSFLLRAHDTDMDPLWHAFYNIQMRHYFAVKKNLDVSAPEGDMIHDLIRDAWEDIHDYMESSLFGPVSNVEKWFRTIHIDFPVEPNDTFSLLDLNEEDLMCQNDTKNVSFRVGV